MCSLLLTSVLIAVWKIPFLYWFLGWSVACIRSANNRECAIFNEIAECGRYRRGYVFKVCGNEVLPG